MANELIINASLPETRIALLESGEIQELLIERASGKGIVGNIYKGRVTRVLPGMQAAFVDIGLEKAAFLYVDDVYVHPANYEAEERELEAAADAASVEGSGEGIQASPDQAGEVPSANAEAQASENAPAENTAEDKAEDTNDDLGPDLGPDDEFDVSEIEDEDEEGDDDDEPVEMSAPPAEFGGEGGGEGDAGSGGGDSAPPEGTMAPSQDAGDASGDLGPDAGPEAGGDASGDAGRRRRFRRGRRGGRNRNRRPNEGGPAVQAGGPAEGAASSVVQTSSESGHAGSAPDVERNVSALPETMRHQLSDTAVPDSDRATLSGEGGVALTPEGERLPSVNRQDFKQQRGRDRRIRPKTSQRGPRAQVNIQDLLKEGQEVLVQVAKDPISTKGARLTCHISLPGRHLVCMPTIDHVGVSRRISRDEERRRLRQFVEDNRPRKLGYIVRTASGKQSERRIEQDIKYLDRLWDEIRGKASTAQAPALVYEDLNSVLRAIRDWVNEDIDKIVVDSRYHFNDIQRFASHFMPSLKNKVELYHGDVPIFDVYGISTELSRALERKVWLKSGGYLVIDQAEALVAIDVNTGRFVGKKNLEDTILKTNLEAVQEIAYQLRLRNCGGIIILDLIDMEKEENKQRVYRALEEALKKDRARPSILKISELGLVEMTRKRTRDTMVRALCEPCAHCEGRGYLKSKQTVAYEIMREIEREGIERDMTKILVQAHADVIDVLAIDDRESLDQLERRYRKQIYLQSVADFHPEQFEVIGDKREGAARESIAVRGRGGRDRNDRNERGDRERGGGRNDRGDRERGGGGRGGRDRNDRNDRSRHSGGHEQPVQAGAEPALPRPLPEFSPDMSEEDRQAYVRAQAAQDAALNGGAPGQAGPNGNGRANGHHPRDPRGGDRGGDRGGRRRRGRRGGRGGRGPRGADFRPRGEGASQGVAGPAPAGVPSGESSGSGGEGGSGPAQPPV